MGACLKRRSVQFCTLAFGIAVTSFGVIRVGMFPIDAPMPQPLAPELIEALEAQGWQVVDTIAARGRKEVSNAEGVVITGRGAPTQLSLSKGVKVSLIPVRTRRSTQLSSETLGRALGADPGKKPGSLKIDQDQFLRFSNVSQRQFATSCIAGGQASTKSEVVSRNARSPSRSRLDRIQKFVGLKPLTNWRCLFVIISLDKGSGVSKKAEADRIISTIWKSLRPQFSETKRLKRVGGA